MLGLGLAGEFDHPGGGRVAGADFDFEAEGFEGAQHEAEFEGRLALFERDDPLAADAGAQRDIGLADFEAAAQRADEIAERHRVRRRHRQAFDPRDHGISDWVGAGKMPVFLPDVKVWRWQSFARAGRPIRNLILVPLAGKGSGWGVVVRAIGGALADVGE